MTLGVGNAILGTMVIPDSLLTPENQRELDEILDYYERHVEHFKYNEFDSFEELKAFVKDVCENDEPR